MFAMNQLMNPEFALVSVGNPIICNIMEKKVKIVLFILFMFFGIRQFFIFLDVWAGTFLSLIGLILILDKKEDVF
jgi:hypothetical protein